MNDPSTANEREQETVFSPKFDNNGLLTAVVVDHKTNAVLMVAFMDQQALDKTAQTGLAHFYSRSRGKLWQKGESSGNILTIQDILVDCDQDTLVLRCNPAGPTCHTGAVSCLYRRLVAGQLKRIAT